MKLPTHMHDKVLVACFSDEEHNLVADCPVLAAAMRCQGGLHGALPPLLRLLQPGVVLQKAIVLQDATPCTDLYILVKGTLQAELSVMVRHELDVKHGEHHNRRGGAGAAAGGGALGLPGLAGGLGGGDDDAAARLAAAVLEGLDSERGGATGLPSRRACAHRVLAPCMRPLRPRPRRGGPSSAPAIVPARSQIRIGPI